MKYEDFKNGLGTDYNLWDTVWVCDYRFNSLTDKPMKHLKPTQVFIVPNSELPRGKRVEFADIHFRPVGRNGKPTSKIIPPYDNSGYAYYTGVSVNIFTSKEDCYECFKEQCTKILKDIEIEKEKFYERMNMLTAQITSEVEEYNK